MIWEMVTSVPFRGWLKACVLGRFFPCLWLSVSTRKITFNTMCKQASHQRGRSTLLNWIRVTAAWVRCNSWGHNAQLTLKLDKQKETFFPIASITLPSEPWPRCALCSMFHVPLSFWGFPVRTELPGVPACLSRPTHTAASCPVYTVGELATACACLDTSRAATYLFFRSPPLNCNTGRQRLSPFSHGLFVHIRNLMNTTWNKNSPCIAC